MAPPADSQQDWNLTYSREMDGVTTLLFHRKINTNDTKDVVIKVNGALVSNVTQKSPMSGNDCHECHDGVRPLSMVDL